MPKPRTAVATEPPEDRREVYAYVARLLRAALSLTGRRGA